MKHSFWVLFSTLLLCCKSEPKPQNPCDLIDLGAVGLMTDSLRSVAQHARAAHLYFEAGEKNESSELFVYAAWQFGESKKIDSALLAVKRAIYFGMNSPYILDKVGIEEESRNSKLRPEINALLDEIKMKNSTVENFEVITTPVDRFWNYFDKAINDTLNAKRYFSEFICEGSNALKDYYHIRYENTENMYRVMIQKNAEYYSYLREFFTADRLKKVSLESEAMMRQFSKLYPKAIFPKTYLVPDLINGTGTLTESALYIGADMFAKSNNMPLNGLNDWQILTITEFENMKYDLVHELMHFQQSYSDSKNRELLLGKLIEEGVCDFLVSLLTEKNEVSPGVQRNLDYLSIEDNYQFVIQELKRDLYGNDLSKWMHNGGQIKDRPSNLGYTMGFLICQSYYEKSLDKQKAIFELLNTNNFKKIIEASDYKEIL